MVDYTNPYLPTIYYGVWSETDLEHLKRNKSLKIIIWTGGDINVSGYRTKKIIKQIMNTINEIKKLTKVIHISISSFIDKSLDGFGLSYLQIPFMGINFDDYKPVIKGPCIYVYTSPGSEKYYGSDLYEKIVQIFPKINFIFTCYKTDHREKHPHILKYGIKYYSRLELINEIYPKCFLGLRLTIHDGY